MAKPPDDRPNDKPKSKLPIPVGRWPWGLILFGLLALWALQAIWSYPWSDPRTQQVSYSQFKQLVRDGKMERVILGERIVRGEQKIEAKAGENADGKADGDAVVEAEPKEEPKKEPRRLLRSGMPTTPVFVAIRVAGDDDLIPMLDEAKIPYSGELESEWAKGGWVAWLIPIGMLVLFWSFMLRRMGQSPGGPGVMTFGKSKAKVYAENDTKVTFDDVAGQEEAKAELKEIIEFLKKPEKFRALGAKIPKGVLLVGPPGTGKTLMAKAVAGEAGVHFFSISGSDFVEMFVGVGAARVRDLFTQAEAKAPCIIFVDELDALGKARGSNPMVGHDEREQTLNQLLAEMDGFDGRKGVIVIGATNRPETLDAALMRAGRFDRQIVVDRPDVKGREAILKVHSRKVKMSPEVNLKQIASQTPGFTGADLGNLINESALHAARMGQKQVEMADFEASIDRVIAGIEKKSRVISPRERARVAHHEAGHAVVASYTLGADRVHKISIIPRGIGALGFTMQLPEEDRYLMTQRELIGKIDVLLGGRVAEELIYNESSTGAGDDLQRATDISKRMITEFGMSANFPNMTLAERRNPFLDHAMGGSARDFSEATGQLIDQEIKDMLADAHARVMSQLTGRIEIVKRVAAALLVEETIEGLRLNELLGIPPRKVVDGDAAEIYPPSVGVPAPSVIQTNANTTET